MDPSGYRTPLREHQLSAAVLSTADVREEQPPDSPIRTQHDSSQLALQFQKMMAQMQGMQQLLLSEQHARQLLAQEHAEQLQEMQNHSQQLQQALAQATIQQPNLSDTSSAIPVAAAAKVQQPVAVDAAPLPDLAATAMPNSLKLDPPEPFTGKKQDVDDWLDCMDLYFLTEIRLPVAQRVPRAILLLRDTASQWLRAMLWLSGTTLDQLTQEGLREEIRKAFRPPDFEFAARDRLAQVKNHTEVVGYTVAFYKAYYQCSNLSEQDAIWWYINNLKPQVATFARTNFPSNLAFTIAAASRYKNSYKGMADPAANPPTHRNPLSKQRNQKNGKCWGQPDGKQPMPGQGTTLKFQGNCNWCGKRGHKEPQCYQKAAERPRQAPATANYTHGHPAYLPAQYASYPPPPLPAAPRLPSTSEN